MRFRYRAYLGDGAIDTGEIEAADRAAALGSLVAAGKSVFDIQEAGAARAGSADAPARRSFFARFARASKPESLFTEMSVLMQAGMTVVQALGAIAEGELAGPRRDLLQEILGAITSGQDAGTAFAESGKFRRDAVSMIASGDAAGNLGEVFSLLADDHETRQKNRAQIREAIAYPIFLCFMIAGAVGLLTFVLVPAIEPIFEDSQAEMPPIVSALVSLRLFLTNWGVVIVSVLGGLVIAAILVPGFRAAIGSMFGRLAGRIPIVGTIRRNLELARYMRSLSMLLRGGASMANSLSLSAKACGDAAIRLRMEGVHDAVAHGQRLASAIRETGLFPSKVVSLITAGDSVNQLPKVTESAATIIEGDARRRIAMLLSLMTPTMTIFLGFMIGGLVLSIMSALLGINAAALP